MISTHILDTTLGIAAQGVKVTLYYRQYEEWSEIARGLTNQDGRYVFDVEKKTGDYRIVFAIEDYFKDKEHFFLDVPVSFRIKDVSRKYHVPLLLNPYGHSTYRGT
jgi:5-hydroxyisourate hydrolase